MLYDSWDNDEFKTVMRAMNIVELNYDEDNFFWIHTETGFVYNAESDWLSIFKNEPGLAMLEGFFIQWINSRFNERMSIMFGQGLYRVVHPNICNCLSANCLLLALADCVVKSFSAENASVKYPFGADPREGTIEEDEDYV